MEFKKTEHGFWRQVGAKPFKYDEAYKAKQGTDEFMSCLRIGFLSGIFGYKLKGMTAVDVGSGNGSFVKAASRVFKRIASYDVAGESITRSELLGTRWDIVILTDVLEHFERIDDLFDIPWRYAMISYPETPEVDRWDRLVGWRHFKPDEHLWCLNYRGVRRWMRRNGCRIERVSDFEDLIRTRWQHDHRNITTVLASRGIASSR